MTRAAWGFKRRGTGDGARGRNRRGDEAAARPHPLTARIISPAGENPAAPAEAGVAAGRSWYQVYLLVLTVLWAAAGWFTGSDGRVIAETFPAWSRHLWYGGLVAGAVLALVGIALHTVVGLLVERVALFVLAGLCGAYGLAFLAYAGRADVGHVLYVVPLVLAYAAVNLVRARQIRRELDQTHRELRRLADALNPEAAS